MITINEFRRCLSYDPITGEMRWKISLGNRAPVGKIINTNCKARYPRVRLHNKLMPAHRVAWALAYGVWPKYEIDHKDRNPKNMRLDNLRDVPHTINMQNTAAKGICFDTSRNKYMAYIDVYGKRKYLGRFDSKAAAELARSTAVKKFFEAIT